MRNAFFTALEGLFRDDPDVVVLTGDLGFKLFDTFRETDPLRFYNVGVAESNMIGLAAGLSLCGKKVFCYSIVPFLVMRPFEQIRIDIAYQNLDVKLVGVGGGFAYGLEGVSHHGLEDVAIMRALPNMTIVAPADPLEAGRIAELAYEHTGPMFIRLSHTNEPAVYDSRPDIEIGRINILAKGEDVAVLASGRMVHECVRALETVRTRDIRPTLADVHTIKPLDTGTLSGLLEEHDSILVVEEHLVDGGLGSAVAEYGADMSYRGLIKRIGIRRDEQCHGRAEFLREMHGLTSDAVAKSIVELMRR